MFKDEHPLPLFPLPNVVLFPDMALPLHIFEPRYRQMIRDAVAGEGQIGMVRLTPGWEGDYEGSPEIRPVGCAGEITDLTELPDGRFTLILVGTQRFEVTGEIGGKPYREGIVRWLPEENAETDEKEAAAAVRRVLVVLFRTAEARGEPGPFSPGSTGTFGQTVNRLVITSGLDPEAMQTLLEIGDLHQRATRLAEILEERLTARGAAESYRPFLPEDPGAN